MEDQIKLLYVEDDPQASELLEKLLRLKYPTVALYTAANGEEGLEVFRRERPDLVITDINMPLVNGTEMSRRIKELAPDIPIIAVTAYHDGDMLSEAAKTGFQDYITKPVEYRLLLQSLDKAIEMLRIRRRR